MLRISHHESETGLKQVFNVYLYYFELADLKCPVALNVKSFSLGRSQLAFYYHWALISLVSASFWFL